MESPRQRAAGLHRTSIIIDALQISRFDRDVFEDMRKGGLTAVNATCSVHENFRETMANIVWWLDAFQRHSDIIRQVKRVDDIHAAQKNNQTGIILGFQNIAAIETDLDLLSVFNALGVKVMQITYMNANLAGQGCLERLDAGLTSFGLELIEEMNRLGILVDLSHVGRRTTLDAALASSKPVALTHANPKRMKDHPRNKTDREIEAVAKTGGVVGATVFPPFLPSGNDSTLADYLDVIDCLVDMAGIDQVGVGTDFTQNQPREFFDWLLTGYSKKGPGMELELPVKLPPEIQSPADFPNITLGLLGRGYSETDTAKIMGGNFLRLFGETWEV